MFPSPAHSIAQAVEHRNDYFEPVGSIARVSISNNAKNSPLSGEATHLDSPQAQRICQICLEQRATHPIPTSGDIPRICTGCSERFVVGAENTAASVDDIQSDKSNESAAWFGGLDAKPSLMQRVSQSLRTWCLFKPDGYADKRVRDRTSKEEPRRSNTEFEKGTKKTCFLQAMKQKLEAHILEGLIDELINLSLAQGRRAAPGIYGGPSIYGMS